MAAHTSLSRSRSLIAASLVALALLCLLGLAVVVVERSRLESVFWFHGGNNETVTVLTSTSSSSSSQLGSFYAPHIPPAHPLDSSASSLTRKSRLVSGSFIQRQGWNFDFGKNRSTCRAKDAPEWRFCDPPKCTKTIHDRPRTLGYPKVVAFNNKLIPTADLIQRALEASWTSSTASDAPIIDLYVRAGCGASTKLYHLLETVHLFWPRILGKVLVVLDANDAEGIEAMIPDSLRMSHVVEVVYERVPCMDGRLFNQYSYLNLFRYSDKADYVVTIDSDCAFYMPITPDVLFNARGQLILPVSKEFQSDYAWDEMQEFFTGHSYRNLSGHSSMSLIGYNRPSIGTNTVNNLNTYYSDYSAGQLPCKVDLSTLPGVD